MNASMEGRLQAAQLAKLQRALAMGATNASSSLGRWIDKDSRIELDALEQLPLDEATLILAADEEPVCFCSVEIKGGLSGEMILAFDDPSGFALCDMLLGQALDTTRQWDEMSMSAALETTNIVCCAYLNALAEALQGDAESLELLPTPPRFSRDFAESLMEFALMGQAVAANHVLLARTNFEIDGTPVNWTLLFVPDANSMQQLPKLLDACELQP